MTEQPKDIVLSNNDMHPAEEIAHLKDLLGKANALARIRAERIKELEAQAGAEPVAWRYITRHGYDASWNRFDPAKDQRNREEAREAFGRIEYAYAIPPDHTAVMRQADKALGLIVQWHEAGFALTDHFVVRAKAAIAALEQALGEGE